MRLMPDTYVPSLTWRLAEYQALMRLRDAAKDRVVPLIVIPKPEYDFDKKRMKRTVPEQVEPFADQFKLKWGSRPAWIDIHPVIVSTRMDDGKLPLEHVFDALHAVGSAAVPVIALAAADEIKSVAAAVIKRDARGIGLRIRLEDMMRPGAQATIAGFLQGIGATAAVTDLIVDLLAPTYEPYDDFCEGFMAAQQNVGDFSQFRSFVLVGTAFPSSVKLDKPGGELPRHDWRFYTTLRTKLPAGARVPNYGDYTTVPPSFAADIDFRKISPPGKLIYTSDGVWMVRKGGAFRKDRDQMYGHCQFILGSRAYRGAAFSDGDDFIERFAKKLAKPTSPTRWKEIGISHHIMHVLGELANPGAPA